MTPEESIWRGYMIRLPGGQLIPNRDNPKVLAAYAALVNRMNATAQAQWVAYLGVAVRIAEGGWEKQMACGHWVPLTDADMRGFGGD